MASLRVRTSSVKIFLLSGVADNVRKDLARKIHLLGGKYFDLQDFKAMCTHVVCGKLSRSEKFLGACATGKWVVHPDYVQDSYIAGCWLDEEQYEWCDDRISQKCRVDMDLALATRRWRFLLGEASAAFTGWKVAVIAGAKRSKVIKRLLISGGAEVFNMRIPVRNPAKVADTIGYIFVSEQNMKSVIHLIDYGVLCIRPEFIGDYLIKDPQPDAMDYIVQVNNFDEVPVDTAESSSQNSFLMESQRSIYLSPPKLAFSQRSVSTPLSSVTSSPASNDTLASKLLHEVTETFASSELPGPSHVVDGKVKPDRIVKTEPMTDYGEVIDLTDDTDENDCNIDKKEHDYTEDNEKLGYNVDRGKGKLETRKDKVVVSNIKVKSEIVEDTDQLNVRKSKRNLVKKSPAWKSLIPSRRTSVRLEEITEQEEKGTAIQTEEKKEEVLAGIKCEHITRNSPSDGRQGSSVKRNLMESLKKGTKPTGQVTSTPLKTPITKKHLLQAKLNMSPITKFFKRIETPVSDRTGRLNKSDFTDHRTTTSAVKVEAGQLNKSDFVNKPSTSAVSSDQSTAFISKVISTTDKSNSNEKKGKGQNKSCLESVERKVVDQSRQKQNDRINNQSAEKLQLDGKGDRKRKSPDTERVDAVFNGPSDSKRVTRSTPTKNEENLLKRTPEKNPDINEFTTIFISPSKRKTLTEKLSEHDEVTHMNNTGDLSSTPTTSVNIDRMASQEEPCADIGRKRKIEKDSELEQVMADIKRRKIGSSEWCTSMFIADLRENEAVPESVCMSTTSTEIFLATLEDGFTFEALQYLTRQVTFKYYPQARVISELMRNVLLTTEEEILSEMSYNILSRMLLLHPPVTAALQDVYLRGLAGCREGLEWYVGAEWNFIDQCLSNLLVSDDVSMRRNNLLLFRFILQLLQQNLQHLSVSQQDCDTRHMLLRIIWSPSYHVVFNKRCRTLVEVMSDVIQTYQAKICDTEKSVLLEVLDGVLWMVAMVTECCRVLECGNIDKVQALQAASTSAFVHEISRKLIDLDLRDPVLLENIFLGFQLSWLRVGVCQQLLNTLDDYLLTEDSVQDSKSLNLLLIVTRYIYLLPVFDVLPRAAGCHSPARTRTKQITKTHPISVSKCLTDNTDMNKENVYKISLKANKRNPKGETQLHVACMKNNVVLVKKLLKVPGIDVNATDNVGWTPLHEACNLGNLECVRELLKFVPSKTMDVFFSKDSTSCRKVDLMVGNGEGITPLHDAVLNNRLEVCQLLLQHGGPKLLEARTILGYTPLDLAETDDMATLLSSYSHVRQKHNDSLNLMGSQDSTCLTEDYIPNEARYEQVMHVEGERVYVNVKSATHYIQLVTLLVKHYITLRNLHLICHGMKHELCQHSREECEQESHKCRGNKLVNVCDSICDNFSCQNSLNISYISKPTSDCVSQTSGRTQSNMKHDRRTEQDRVDASSRPTVGQGEVTSIKEDLKILKNMSYYIKLFKTHLLKICRPEDSPVIEKELQDLSFVTEDLLY